MPILINDSIRICIEKEGYISSLQYKNKEYVGGKVPLFEIKYLNSAGDDIKINSEECVFSSCEFDNNSLLIVYKKEGTEIRVSVSLTNRLSFGIEIGADDSLVPEWVNYPGICVPDVLRDNGGTSKILWGFNEGSLIEDLSVRESSWFPYKEPTYPSIGLYGLFPAGVETQFMAYYDDVSGMYFASHDNKNNLKGIDFYRRGGGIALQFLHYTGADFGSGYKMPYEQIIDFFEGDWRDACEIYRDWFDKNKPSDMIKISENPRIPDWYSESPIVITYPVRGKFDTDVMTPNKLFPYVNVMPHVERFERLFASKLMILLMHWEGTAPWAPPIVWPPYGGEDELKKLIDALHERGDVFGVYCSGLGWTIKSNLDAYDTRELFDQMNLKDEMCLSPKGELPYSKICTAQRSGYDMCPTRDFAKNTIKREVISMASAGIDYIQLMDQNHGGTSYFCYSKEHGHPPVPGKWQVDAVKSLLRSASADIGNVLLGCESAAAESYIPELGFSDNRFDLTYAIGKPVPAYSYIYHEYVNNFMGNQVCADYFVTPDKNPESYYERIAYAFSAGDLLTVIINDDGEIERSWGKDRNIEFMPDAEKTASLVKNLNAWRQKYPNYLNTGRMEKPLAIDCQIHTMQRKFGSTIDIPKIHTSAFSDHSGSLAQFLINWTDNDVEAEIKNSTVTYVIRDINGNELTPSENKKIKIPPLCAVMMETKK